MFPKVVLAGLEPTDEREEERKREEKLGKKAKVLVSVFPDLLPRPVSVSVCLSLALVLLTRLFLVLSPFIFELGWGLDFFEPAFF